MNSGVPIPCPTTRGFHVNPSPHEIAVGAIEQWRRSKLSKAWKNVLVSLVKGSGGGGLGSLCIWRESIAYDGSPFLEILQQVSFREMQHVAEEGGILRISLYHSLEDPLTFRCMDEPAAIRDWATAIRTVCQFVQNPSLPAPTPPKPAAPPPPNPVDINLMSFETTAQPAIPDLLLPDVHPPPPQQYQPTPPQYQTYPNGLNGFPQVHQPQAPIYIQPNTINYAAYQQPRPGLPLQQQRQQQPSAFPFSQPPPLPMSVQTKSRFAVQQATNLGYHHPLHQRSLTPPPSNFRNSAPVAADVPLANRFPQPAPKPRGAPPQRSFSAPLSPRSSTTTTSPGAMSDEELKRRIITSWALQPPHNRGLKPLIELVRTIPTVFPPTLSGVPPHEYFGRWKPVTPGEYHQPGGMDKILRRLRFFLHPDKLPQDFTDQQAFLCQLLWDIINDAQHQQQASK